MSELQHYELHYYREAYNTVQQEDDFEIMIITVENPRKQDTKINLRKFLDFKASGNWFSYLLYANIKYRLVKCRLSIPQFYGFHYMINNKNTNNS